MLIKKVTLDREEKALTFLLSNKVEVEYTPYSVSAKLVKPSKKTPGISYKISYIEIVNSVPALYVEKFSGNVGKGFLGSYSPSFNSPESEVFVEDFPIYVADKENPEVSTAISLLKDIVDVPKLSSSSISPEEVFITNFEEIINTPIIRVLEFFNSFLEEDLDPEAILSKDNLLMESLNASNRLVAVWNRPKK